MNYAIHRHGTALPDTIVSGDDHEVIDTSEGWALLADLAEGTLEDAIANLAEGPGRVIAVARRTGDGVPFVPLARVEANDEADDDDDDPYLELGEGD